MYPETDVITEENNTRYQRLQTMRYLRLMFSPGWFMSDFSPQLTRRRVMGWLSLALGSTCLPAWAGPDLERSIYPSIADEGHPDYHFDRLQVDSDEYCFPVAQCLFQSTWRATVEDEAYTGTISTSG